MQTPVLVPKVLFRAREVLQSSLRRSSVRHCTRNVICQVSATYCRVTEEHLLHITLPTEPFAQVDIKRMTKAPLEELERPSFADQKR